jgi:hypothetical protein
MGLVVLMALSLETIPLGILLSAAWDHRSWRRRSRFWLRLAAIVIFVMLPELILIAGSGARVFDDQTVTVLLWAGLVWGGATATVTPLLLFHRPGPSPGSDDGPDGPDPDDEPPSPRRPDGGIPLPDARQPAIRTRGDHRGRRATHPRRPVHPPRRAPSRVRPLLPGQAVSRLSAGGWLAPRGPRWPRRSSR